MGYYSNFEITIANEKANVEEIAEPLSQISGYKIDYLDDETLLINDIKWYNWENDMIELSKQFPWAVIEVSRFGEDTLDWEVALFINGKEFSKNVEYVKPITILKKDPEVQQAIKEANAMEKQEYTCSFDEMRQVMIKNGEADPDEEEVFCSNCEEPLYEEDYPKIRFRKDSDDVHFYCPICGKEL